MKRVVLIGRIGPAYGDGRASYVDIEFVEPGMDDAVSGVRVANWPRNERTDALRVAFDHAGSAYGGDWE